MRRIEQRAIGTVVDEQLRPAAPLDLDDQRVVLGAQRTARLAPQLGRVGDRQRFVSAVDDPEVILERGRFHPRIDRGEAAADIDDVDQHRGLDDRRANPLERLDIGVRAHRLAADVEAHAERIGDLAGGLEQRRGIGEIDPELGGQAQLRMLGRDPQPDAQREVFGLIGRGRRSSRALRCCRG